MCSLLPRSFVTPVTPVNPLAFLPEYDPLVLRDRHLFGKVPPPLPVGSAMLAPGQKPPAPSQPAPLPPAHAPAGTQPHANLAVSSASTSWKNLLAQAAAAFLASGDSNEVVSTDDGHRTIDSSTLFTGEAYRAIEAARRTRRSASAGDAATSRSMSGEGDEGYQTAASDEGMPPATEVKPLLAASGPGQDEGRKKKKRQRKRVGH